MRIFPQILLRLKVDTVKTILWMVQKNSNKTRENERKNILCEIFYVVSVRISGEILEDQNFWDGTNLMEIRVTCFLFV